MHPATRPRRGRWCWATGLLVLAVGIAAGNMLTRGRPAAPTITSSPAPWWAECWVPAGPDASLVLALHPKDGWVDGTLTLPYRDGYTISLPVVGRADPGGVLFTTLSGSGLAVGPAGAGGGRHQYVLEQRPGGASLYRLRPTNGNLPPGVSVQPVDLDTHHDKVADLVAKPAGRHDP